MGTTTPPQFIVSLLLILSSLVSGCASVQSLFARPERENALVELAPVDAEYSRYALPTQGLEFVGPKDLRAPKKDSKPDSVTLRWMTNGFKYVYIEREKEELSLKSAVKELNAIVTGFQLVESSELAEGGYDFYYSAYDSSANKVVGYNSRVIVDGTPYRCGLTTSHSLAVMKEKRKICRSLAKYRSPPTK